MRPVRLRPLLPWRASACRAGVHEPDAVQAGSDADISAAVREHVVTVRGIVVKLTKVAAKALNAALGTKLFAPGLTLGTASTRLRL